MRISHASRFTISLAITLMYNLCDIIYKVKGGNLEQRVIRNSQAKSSVSRK